MPETPETEITKTETVTTAPASTTTSTEAIKTETTTPATVTTKPATSGINGPMPDELRGFNWGAFFFSWIWGLNHKTYITLITLVVAALNYYTKYNVLSVISLALIIWFGFKGNEWAWQNRKFENAEQFKAVQRKWMIWGLVLFIIVVVLGGIMLSAGLSLFSSAFNSGNLTVNGLTVSTPAPSL